jgi:hypothetical protein
MRRIEAGATAFAIGVDVLGEDLMEERRRLRIVVIGRHGCRVGVWVFACVEPDYWVGLRCDLILESSRMATTEVLKILILTLVVMEAKGGEGASAIAQPLKNKEVACLHACRPTKNHLERRV